MKHERRQEPASSPPSPAAAVLFDVTVADTSAVARAKIELLYVAVAAELLGRALKDDTAAFHDVAVVGDGQSRVCVLLDKQDRQVEFLPRLAKTSHQFPDEERRDPRRPLDNNHHFRFTEQALRSRRHLTLTATEVTRGLLPPLR